MHCYCHHLNFLCIPMWKNKQMMVKIKLKMKKKIKGKLEKCKFGAMEDFCTLNHQIVTNISKFKVGVHFKKMSDD